MWKEVNILSTISAQNIRQVHFKWWWYFVITVIFHYKVQERIHIFLLKTRGGGGRLRMFYISIINGNAHTRNIHAQLSTFFSKVGWNPVLRPSGIILHCTVIFIILIFHFRESNITSLGFFLPLSLRLSLSVCLSLFLSLSFL